MNSDYTNIIKVYEDYFEFKTDRKSAERQKLVFQKNRWKIQTYINPY